MTVRRPSAAKPAQVALTPNSPALAAKAAAGPAKTTASVQSAKAAPLAAPKAAMLPAGKAAPPVKAASMPTKAVTMPAAKTTPSKVASEKAPASVPAKPVAKVVAATPGKPNLANLAHMAAVGGALRKRALVTRPASDTPPPPPSASVAGYELEAQIGYKIRRAHQRATDIFGQMMTKFDVTPTQFAALAKLHDLGLVSQNHLGRLTGMDPSTILGVVGRLIRQGHVRARPDPADGRLTLLELTPTGRTQVEAMKTVAPQVSERTLEPLSPKDQKILLELLQKIV